VQVNYLPSYNGVDLPSMTRTENSPDRVALERRLLRALCACDLNRAESQKIGGQLSSYSWSDPDHVIVFKALQRMRAGNQEIAQKDLAAHATRMGFPDIGWETYLDDPGGSCTPSQVMNMAKELTELSNHTKKAT
jgi:hypothetical protein